jgi:hypothetical protein
MQAIHYATFLIAFILGGIMVYSTAPPTNTIVVYPTPSNVKKVEYKDLAGQCYKYRANKIKCPRTGSIPIPLQE